MSFKNGNPKSAEELLEKLYEHKEILISTTRSFLKTYISRDEVEDVFQVACWKAYKSYKTFRGEANFITWFSRIAINVALDFKRQQSRFRRVNARLDLYLLFYGDRVRYEEEIDAKRVNEVLSEAPENYKTFLYLYYYHGHSIREIAELLGLSERTVYSRLHYARCWFKKNFTKLNGKEI